MAEESRLRTIKVHKYGYIQQWKQNSTIIRKRFERRLLKKKIKHDVHTTGTNLIGAVLSKLLCRVSSKLLHGEANFD